jgi:hypothetical protein
VANKHSFIANVSTSVAYVDLFVLFGKPIATYQDSNNTYIINNNTLLFTNHLKQ